MKKVLKRSNDKVLTNLCRYFLPLILIIITETVPLIRNMFSFSVFAAFVYLNFNIYIMLFIKLGIGFCFNPSLISLLQNGLATFIFVAVIYIFKFANKKPQLYLSTFFCFCSLLVTLLFDFSNLLTFFIMLILATFAYVAFVVSIQSLRNGLKNRKMWDEKIAYLMCTIVLAFGIFNVSFWGIELNLIVGAFFICLLTFMFGFSHSAAFVVAFFLPELIVNFDNSSICGFILIALPLSFFIKGKGYLIPITAIFMEAVLGFLIKIYPVYNFYSFLSFVIGSLVFLCLPKNIGLFYSLSESATNKNLSRLIINRNSEILEHKLSDIGVVFAEMEEAFLNNNDNYIKENRAIEIIVDETLNNVCHKCPNFRTCKIKEDDDLNDFIYSITYAGMKKGQANLLDLPTLNMSRCYFKSELLTVINKYLDDYKKYNEAKETSYLSKKLLKKQLNGVSKILKALSKDTAKVVFDSEMEDELKSELTLNRIYTDEIIIYENATKEKEVCLLIKNGKVIPKKIVETVSLVMRCRMSIDSCLDSAIKGFKVYILKPAPLYDVIFGLSGIPKENSEISGDTHSLVRLNNSKFLFALCDGMGSGKNAESLSSNTISAIESFYKAGFDDEVVFSIVNNLMSLKSNEDFSAIDVASIDLKTGEINFIKFCASKSYIKKKNGIKTIIGSSLPLGILEEVKPSSFRTQLACGDFVVLGTDGVFDVFEENELEEFLYCRNYFNPQSLADDILKEALKRSENHPKDDMTVIVMKLVNLC